MTHYHGGTDWQEGGGEGPESFKPTDLFGCDPDFVAVPSDYQLGYADGLAEARNAVEQAKDEFVHATDAAKGDFALRVYDDTLRAIDALQPRGKGDK